MRALVVVLLLSLATLPPPPVAATGCAGGAANDCVADAVEWFAEPALLSNVGATMEPGEPSTCDGATVHRSVWLRIDVLAPGAGDPFQVVFDAPFWATAGAYALAGDGSLAQVACQASWEDEGRWSPRLYLPCTAGATYWLQVGGQSNADVGTFSLREERYWKFDRTLSEACPFEATLPSAPRMYLPTGGNGQITVSWVEPAWDGGRTVAISHYRVYGTSDPACASGFELLGEPTSRSFLESGLAPETRRCYEVTAVNPVGEGPSEPARSATTWALPRAPLGLSVAPAGAGELALAWSPSPDQESPTPVTAHRVYRAQSVDGPFELVGATDGDARGHVDAGLARGTTWHYRVSAVSAVGEGPLGDAAWGTTWTTPGTPRDVTVRQPLGLPSFEVTWTPPGDGAPFTHYRIYRASAADGPATLVGEVPASTLRYSERAPGVLVDYHYEVRASNPSGEGAPSTRGCAVWPLESPLARC